ncbi:MAG: hypothetical protein ACK41U_02985 [Paracoccus sp. (in: a-proteobacteria)]|uniref:hypothetical protein n=1 Tax=Paracoccus sp. TaxID=267 RepID=UPI003918DC66
MFDDKDTARLITAMRVCGVTLLEIETGDTLLRLALPAQVAAPGARTPPDLRREAARSPEIGTFLPRGSDDGLIPLVQGDSVQVQETVGYVTRGAIRAVVLAPTAGRIADAPPAEGTIFGFGDTVVEVEPA